MASSKTNGVLVRTRTTRRLATDFGKVAAYNGRSTAEELRRLMEAHVRNHDAPRKGDQL